MKIRIDDGMQTCVGTGIGKYTAHLADALRAAQKGEREVELFAYSPKGKRIFKRLAYLLHINSRKYRRASDAFDVVHFTNYAMPHFCSKKAKYAVTVHDLAVVLQPATLPFLYRIYAKWVLRHTLRRADQIFTVSESVKREIEQYFPKSAHKVTAIYPGIYGEMGCAEATEAFDDPRLRELEGCPFLLMVGTVEKRKNPEAVISAYFLLRSAGKLQNCKLVLAGRDGYGAQDYHEMAEGSPYGKDVIFTGYVSNNDINRLYEKTSACIFSTLYEGFGSTQLECMAHGVPLILSDIPTNREVSGDYGRFFALGDQSALEALMQDAVEIPDTAENRAQRVEKTRIFLQKLDWNALAPAYLAAYQKMIEK